MTNMVKTRKFKIEKKAVIALSLIIMTSAWLEYRHSMLQSWLLASYAAELRTKVEPGPSDAIVFPSSGPFNKIRGYPLIPDFSEQLNKRGFVIEEQARFSPELLFLTDHEFSAPYREPDVAGLVIKEQTGEAIYDATLNRRGYKYFHDIPALIVKTLLYMEDRELIRENDVRKNPVINWGRFSRASVLYAAKQFGLQVPREGGSTLATQLEKFRYSPDGRTNSVSTKLQQIFSASLKAYRNGTDTTNARRHIVLDYLNSVPFAAISGYGEIHGLPQAMYLLFGLEADEIAAALNENDINRDKVETFKKVLTLLCAIPAPSYYLKANFSKLQERVLLYTYLLEKEGVIGADFAAQLRQTKIELTPHKTAAAPISKPLKKAVNNIRSNLLKTLAVPSYYALDRFALQVESSIDAQLQTEIMALLKRMKQPKFVRQQGLNAYRLLARGSPENLVYSFLLYEITPLGNELRVHADTNPQPFDINKDMKLDLGSTAKLRTLVHYLEIMHELYQDQIFYQRYQFLSRLPRPQDPLSVWARNTNKLHKGISIEDFLRLAMQRKYSANPEHAFFTGGGIHNFANFDPRDNKRSISVSEATMRSVNLVYVRIMRDLVRFHKARLHYDVDTLLKENDHPLRNKYLVSSSDREAKIYLKRFYHRYHGLSAAEIVNKMVKHTAHRDRALSILFFSWNPDASAAELEQWLMENGAVVSKQRLAKLVHSFKQTNLTRSDYAFLLKKHPLELWLTGKLYRDSEVEWQQLLDTSATARRKASSWLLKTRNKKVQNRHLSIKIEQDAFARMTDYWKRVGYPFTRLIPSLATAIGSSADRPEALAELMGIIVNDGFRRPEVLVKKLRLAENTPYHTVFQRTREKGEQVLPYSVAKVIKETLRGTVEKGTARRINGAFDIVEEVPIAVGGKTGSGDNRIKTFSKDARLLSSRAINRTATFVFYIGDRFFGVITAHVSGPESEQYGFTSSLPVAVLKLMVPSINVHMRHTMEQSEWDKKIAMATQNGVI